jgi:uncharacterized membrane protein YdbT with pleckstrin-like domain
MAKSYLDSLLGEREKIQLVARPHWFILVSSIALEIFTILVILAAIVTSVILVPHFALLAAVIGFALMLIPIISMMRDILIYTHHEYIITNLRVIQLSGILNKEVIDSSLEKVNDVKMSQTALGRIFNYGDVEILTASELGVNLFRRIENPVQFKTAMLNAKARLESGEHWGKPPAQAASGNVPALLSQLDGLRQQGVLTEEEFQQKKAQLLTKI